MANAYNVNYRKVILASGTGGRASARIPQPHKWRCLEARPRYPDQRQRPVPALRGRFLGGFRAHPRLPLCLLCPRAPGALGARVVFGRRGGQLGPILHASSSS